MPKAGGSVNPSGVPSLGNAALSDLPWFDDPFRSTSSSGNWNKFMINSSNVTFLGWWTFPYYQCSSRRWTLTYSIPVTSASSSTISSADRFDFLLIWSSWIF